VLKEIAPEVSDKTLIISVAASVPPLSGTTPSRREWDRQEKRVPVIRAMPNTPAAVGCGMTGVCRGAHAGAEHLEIARAMFEAVAARWSSTKKIWTRLPVFPQRPGFRLHNSRIAGRSWRKSGPAPRCRYTTGRANHEGRCQRGAGNRRASRATEGRGYHSRRLHHRRHPGAGRSKLRVTLIKAVVKATSRAGELLFEK